MAPGFYHEVHEHGTGAVKLEKVELNTATADEADDYVPVAGVPEIVLSDAQITQLGDLTEIDWGILGYNETDNTPPVTYEACVHISW